MAPRWGPPFLGVLAFGTVGGGWGGNYGDTNQSGGDSGAGNRPSYQNDDSEVGEEINIVKFGNDYRKKDDSISSRWNDITMALEASVVGLPELRSIVTQMEAIIGPSTTPRHNHLDKFKYALQHIFRHFANHPHDELILAQDICKAMAKSIAFGPSPDGAAHGNELEH